MSISVLLAGPGTSASTGRVTLRRTCPVWSHVCPTEGWRPSEGPGLPCTCVLSPRWRYSPFWEAHPTGKECHPGLAPWHRHLACPPAMPTCKALQSSGACGLLQVGIHSPLAISLERHWDLHRWGECWEGKSKCLLFPGIITQ